MFLRSLPLGRKLIGALLLPVLLVVALLGVRINDAVHERGVASAQEQEVRQFQAVTAFADAIGREGRSYFDFTQNDQDIAAARSAVDDALEIVLSPALGLDVSTMQAMVDIHARLLTARERVGASATEMRLDMQRELIDSMQFGEAGTMVGELGVPQDLYPEVLASFSFDESAISDADTVTLITTYQLVQDIRAGFSDEITASLGVAPLPPEAVTPFVTEFIATTISDTDKSVDTLRTLGSSRAIASLDAFLDGPSYTEYLPIRETFQQIVPRESPEALRPLTLIPVGDGLNAELVTIANDAVAELDANSSQASNAATRRLIESVVLGAAMLLIVGLILWALYRAIRSPLLRLTERSKEIAEVELPMVVRAMRDGDVDGVPEVREIAAQSNDEIGELVVAFNGMYRTAVELASEQAASRRAVADMFVNLGRRNQKLLNRMLKGLTLLQQDEQDPDTLGALYKVDHLATRMRRNAESLLILAGASQSRTWAEAVPVYDVVQAALSEVENFERVDIDVDADSDQLVVGDCVADLTHLVAELVENALVYSPPTTIVEVVCRQTARGHVIAVSDSGVGMPADAMADANDRIKHAAEQDESPSEFLGHYVVGRLAARRGFDVDLLEGVAGGVVARVMLPTSTLSSASDEPLDVISVDAEMIAQPSPNASGLSGLAALSSATDAMPEPAPDFDFAAAEADVAADLSTTADTSAPAHVADAPNLDHADLAWMTDRADETIEVPRPDTSDASTAFTPPIEDEVPAVEVDRPVTQAAPVNPLAEVSPLGLPPPLPDAQTPDARVPLTVPTPELDADESTRPPLDLPRRSVDADESARPPLDLPTRVPGQSPPIVDERRPSEPAIPQAPIVADRAAQPLGLPTRVPGQSRPIVDARQEAPPTLPAAASQPVDDTAASFPAARRKPGASLPVGAPRADATSAATTEPNNPDEIRSSLSGFQTGVVRAEEETN